MNGTMRKVRPELSVGFGVGRMEKLSGYSGEWLRTLEKRGVLGPVQRISGRREYTTENLERLAAYQKARGKR